MEIYFKFLMPYILSVYSYMQLIIYSFIVLFIPKIEGFTLNIE
jgi:hypothetical protein